MSHILCFSPQLVSLLKMFLKTAKMQCDQEKAYNRLKFKLFTSIKWPETTTSSSAAESVNLAWHELYIPEERFKTGDIYKTLVVHWLFIEGLMILNYSFIGWSERCRTYESEVWRKVTAAYWATGLVPSLGTRQSRESTWILHHHETSFRCLPRAFQIKHMISS